MDKLLFPYIRENTLSQAQMMAIGEISNWGSKILNPDAIWTQTKGRGVKVAVIDTGCDLTHPDLKGNILEAFDPYANDPTDYEGHGTHVAGLIAAQHNDFGAVGVAPEASLLTAKGLDDSGAGDWYKIAKAIQWAVKSGAQIINMSLGSNSRPPKIMHDAIKWATAKGVICVAASGNDPGVAKGKFSIKDTAYPARYPEVIAVAAVDQDGHVTNFSQITGGVDVVAPGVDLYSTYKDGQYAKLTGTSQACPLISGSCALLKAYYGDAISSYKDMLFKLEAITTEKNQVASIAENIAAGVPDFSNVQVQSLGEAVIVDNELVDMFEDQNWETIEGAYKQNDTSINMTEEEWGNQESLWYNI